MIGKRQCYLPIVSNNINTKMASSTSQGVDITNPSVSTILRGLRELYMSFSNTSLPEPPTSSSSQNTPQISTSDLENLLVSLDGKSGSSNSPILETILQLTTHVRASLGTIAHLSSLVISSPKAEASTQTEDLICSSCGLYAVHNHVPSRVNSECQYRAIEKLPTNPKPVRVYKTKKECMRRAMPNFSPKLRCTKQKSGTGQPSVAKIQKIEKYRARFQNPVIQSTRWRSLRSSTSDVVSDNTTGNSSEPDPTFRRTFDAYTVSSGTMLESEFKREKTVNPPPSAIEESPLDEDSVAISNLPLTLESESNTISIFGDASGDPFSVQNIKSESAGSAWTENHALESDSCDSDDDLMEYLQNGDDLHRRVEENILLSLKHEWSSDDESHKSPSISSACGDPVRPYEPPTASQAPSSQRSTYDEIIDAVASDLSIIPRFKPTHLRPQQHHRHINHDRRTGRPHRPRQKTGSGHTKFKTTHPKKTLG